MAFFKRSGGRSRASVAAVAAVMPFAAGCSIFGGQSSDDTGEGCPFNTVELESDAATSSLGFAPDVLSWAFATRTTDARWQASWSGISTNAPEGDTEITVTVARGAGPATEQTCEQTRVHVPAVLDVSTSDGLVALSVPAELDAARDGFVRVNAEFDFEDLTGTFAWQSEERGVELVQPRVSLAVTPTGTSGSFTAIRQVTGSGAISDTPVPAGGLLAWPAGSRCPTDQVALVVAEADPLWSEGPALLDSATWVEAGGDADGVPVTVSLSTDASLCESDVEAARLPARLTLRTEDGVVDQAMLGHVVLAEEGVQFTNEYTKYWLSPSEFSQLPSDFGKDLSVYESISVIVRVTVAGETGEGKFRVEGAVDECSHECTADGCPGCEGFRDEVIVERRFVVSASL